MIRRSYLYNESPYIRKAVFILKLGAVYVNYMDHRIMIDSKQCYIYIASLSLALAIIKTNSFYH